MKAFEKKNEWAAVKDVTARLKEAGFEALLAGGCVRDFLMRREPNDFDIATNATPDEVERLFPRSIAVGKAFGVIILPFEGFQIEVATFREDLDYKDGRRPEGVRFSTVENDAARRDFTINALFYDVSADRVIDFVKGEADITAKIIRTVGKPDLRFDEDKLRILRAVRFSGQLDFEIGAETYDAVCRRAQDVLVVSWERIRDEIQKLLKYRSRLRGVGYLISSGLLEVLFPSFAKVAMSGMSAWFEPFENQWAETVGRPGDAASMALFLKPAFDTVSEADFRSLLKSLKLESRFTESILFSLKNLGTYLEPSSVRVGVMAQLLLRPESPVAEEVANAIEPDRRRRESLAALRLSVVDSSGRAVAPLITGEIVREAGIAPGPAMGAVIQEAYLLQLEGAFANLASAKQWLAKR